MENEEQKDTEVLDFTQPAFAFIPKGNHEWRQRGPYLICFNCDLDHAVWVGVGRIMVGLNDKGLPIMKRL